MTNSIVDPTFFSSWAASGQYPGDNAGGATPRALSRTLATTTPDGPMTEPRTLTLTRIHDYSGHYQFAGDGSAAHPTLFDRDVVAFFPYQVSDRTWVAGAYVMTRNLATNYNPSAPDSDPTRYDLPGEIFRLSLGGVSSCNLNVSATDPMTGTAVAASLVSCSVPTAVIELPLTDSPRMLTIQEPEPPLVRGAYRPVDPVRIRPVGGAPGTSSVNFPAGRNVANRVIAKLPTGGQVQIYNSVGRVDVVVDVTAWYTDGSDGAATGALYHPVRPYRVIDTRPAFQVGPYSAPVGPRQNLSPTMAGTGLVPATGVTAVATNVTVTDGTQATFVTTYPSDRTLPLASDLNVNAGQTVPALGVTRLSADGRLSAYNDSGAIDLIIDLEGWYG